MEILHKFIDKIISLLPTTSYVSALEEYIVRQRPQDVCQLEIIQKEFDRSFIRR